MAGRLHWWRRICWPFPITGHFPNPGTIWFMIMHLTNIYRASTAFEALGWMPGYQRHIRQCHRLVRNTKPHSQLNKYLLRWLGNKTWLNFEWCYRGQGRCENRSATGSLLGKGYCAQSPLCCLSSNRLEAQRHRWESLSPITGKSDVIWPSLNPCALKKKKKNPSNLLSIPVCSGAET